jgi:hypothetical protein
MPEQPSLHGRPAFVVFISAGCILITAAALKAHNLYHDPFAVDPILPTRALMVAALVFEFGIGVWLLTGVFPRAVRVIAATLFGFFGTVSLDRALNGEASCGCFGGVTVTPWLVSALDLCIATALAMLRRPEYPASYALRVPLAVLAVATMGVAAVWLLQNSSVDARLVVDPTTVQFGRVRHGERKTVIIILTNPGDFPVTISSMRTSCPCLTVRLPEQTVQPHKSVQAILEYDPLREPDFTGRLLVTAEGLDQSGQPLFRATGMIVVE